jgi:hydrogenase-4 component F
MEGVTGLLRQMPGVGGGMLLATLALAGLPPFGLFISELLIATGAYDERPWVAYVFLGLLVVAFAALVYQVFRMVLGEPKETGILMTPVGNRFTAVALAANLVAMGYIGIHMPGFLRALFIPMTRVFHAMVEVP